MTSLTLVVLATMLFGLLGRQGYGRALALGGVTASGAAAVVGGIALPTFYAVALGALGALALQLLGDATAPRRVRRPLPPGVPLLLFFFAWSVLVTLAAPLVFDGLTVYTPNGAVQLAAGYYTSSNLAQVIYLALGVCVVVFLARSPRSGPELIGLVGGTAIALSLWRHLNQVFGLPYPEGVFDNSPAFEFIETAPGGGERFRGIFSEPAGVASVALVTIAYMVPRAFHVHGARRAAAISFAVIAGYLGVISTSTTFVVAGVALVLIATVSAVLRFVLRRAAVSVAVSVAGCVLVIAGLWLLPIIAEFVETAVGQKVNSSSFTERTSANTASVGLFLDTFGFGVGLGSNRASSFVSTLLSTTGIVGTLAFAAAMASLVYRSAGIRRYRPVIWAFVAVLITKVIAGPDLHDTSGVFWISLGLLSGAVARDDERRDREQSLLVSAGPSPGPWAGPVGTGAPR